MKHDSENDATLLLPLATGAEVIRLPQQQICTTLVGTHLYACLGQAKGHIKSLTALVIVCWRRQSHCAMQSGPNIMTDTASLLLWQPFPTPHSTHPTPRTVAFDCAAGALHTVAVKANPVGKVLQVFRDHGMGAEVRPAYLVGRTNTCGCTDTFTGYECSCI